MRQSLVPVLLLATAAISSSNVLPMLAINQLETEQSGSDDQQHDNIFSNNYHTRDLLRDDFFKLPVGTYQSKIETKSRKSDEKLIDVANIESEENYKDREITYDDDGFRKEQWHNYPRQLDRLNEYLREHRKANKNLDPDPDEPDTTKGYFDATSGNNDVTNEILPNGNQKWTFVPANPLLILKIRLNCLSKDLIRKYARLSQLDTDLMSDINDSEKYKLLEDYENPDMNIIKVKRDEPNDLYNSKDTGAVLLDGKKMVNKRIFSLWSRLQGMSPRGHELHHRRHIHAFYGLPDDDGGVLTAETRAAMMRPPGSPLRWG